MRRKEIIEKEYYRVHKDHAFFNGFFTREKLIVLIDLKEKEGWSYMGDKDILKIGSFGMGLGDSDIHYSRIVAVFDRNPVLPESGPK